MPRTLVNTGGHSFFEGRKYSSVYIDMIADMRRGNSPHGQLDDADLQRFVMRCLRTPDYQVFGMPMSQADYTMVERLQQSSVLARCG
jgi:hypothetical protein